MKRFPYWMLATAFFLTTTTFGQTIPELVFQNPVLISGTAGQDGAVYKFSNVTKGVDATVKIRRRSSAAVILTNIDVTSTGWSKAFQPQVGIPGKAPANTMWWMDFEMTFLKAGTSEKTRVKNFVVTSIDTDGDGVSIREFVQFEKIKSVAYCPVTYLKEEAVLVTSSVPTGAEKCGECTKSSSLKTCTNCYGSGINSGKDCGNCKGTGKLHTECGHAWQSIMAPLTGTNATGITKRILGPVQNYTDIDTLGTPVMATYQYEEKDVIRFTIGGKSGTYISNAGERLNSLWFKSFSLAPPTITLPVRISSFAALYDNKNVNLSWTTSYEENFSHYIVERSTDGKAFTEVALVFADGNTAQTRNYTYKDANAASATGTLYYRLRLVEKSNEASYTAIRVVKLTKEETLQLSTYPNPVKDVLRLTLPYTWQGKKVSLALYGSTGLQLQTLILNNAGLTETLNLASLANGVYVVTAACEGQTVQQRIVKN